MGHKGQPLIRFIRHDLGHTTDTANDIGYLDTPKIGLVLEDICQTKGGIANIGPQCKYKR